MSTTAPAKSQTKPKRKRKVLTLEDKLVILDRLSKRERQVDLALEFGVGTSTVADIKKNEANLLIAVMHVLCNPDFTYP